MDEQELLRWYEIIPHCAHVYYCNLGKAFAFVTDKLTGEFKLALKKSDGTYEIMTQAEFDALF